MIKRRSLLEKLYITSAQALDRAIGWSRLALPPVTDFTPPVYTQAGMSWIADNTFATVLRRHAPALGPARARVDNAFAPWPIAVRI